MKDGSPQNPRLRGPKWVPVDRCIKCPTDITGNFYSATRHKQYVVGERQKGLLYVYIQFAPGISSTANSHRDFPVSVCQLDARRVFPVIIDRECAFYGTVLTGTANMYSAKKGGISRHRWRNLIFALCALKEPCPAMRAAIFSRAAHGTKNLGPCRNSDHFARVCVRGRALFAFIELRVCRPPRVWIVGTKLPHALRDGNFTRI